MGNTDYRIKARQIDSPDQIRLTASTLFPQSHNSANFLPHFAIFSISNLAIFTKVGIIDYITKEISFRIDIRYRIIHIMGYFFICTL